IVIPPAIFFYYSTLFDSRFKTLQQNQKEKQYLVKIAVRYLDNETKIENISQYQLTLEKKDNWKIIMNE
ncbi:conjugal transfer protein, partial [Enterococcus avium]|nr:conjugal transfer protein [Enterococcus avium]MDT2507821.1 conjugal transfer protein [Enterococcus avium]MDT2719124.1 conjugal transfer protein [Enterococcus gallinarum]MDT2966415.1 conjugal transfer protein [Enterococcus casseliflavus]